MKSLKLLFWTIFVLSFVFLSINIVFASSDSWVEWSYSYGDERDEVCYSVVNTYDGGYALGGYIGSLVSGNSDYLLIKTDSLGNVVWNQTYGGTDYDICYSMIGTSDGGYALAGSSWSFSNGLRDFWLVKTDNLGNVEWNQSYGGKCPEVAYSLVQTWDEGFALAGYIYCTDAGLDFWIVKTDANGNMMWNKTFSGTGYSSIAYSIVKTSDSGLAIAGTTETRGGTIDYIRLIKTDGLGNIVWEFQNEGGDGDSCRDVVETGDGGFILTCKIQALNSEDHELGLIKIDSEGNQIWSQTYGEGFADSLIETSDGGFALAGFTKLGYGNRDFLLIKTDNSGKEELRRFYGTPEHERAYSVVETSDGFALAGYREVWKPNNSNFWLVKTNLQGIPEFPSWTILPLVVATTLIAIYFKKKILSSSRHYNSTKNR